MRQPEGRRRQDHDRRQPRLATSRSTGCASSSSTWTPRATRPAVPGSTAKAADGPCTTCCSTAPRMAHASRLVQHRGPRASPSSHPTGARRRRGGARPHRRTRTPAGTAARDPVAPTTTTSSSTARRRSGSSRSTRSPPPTACSSPSSASTTRSRASASCWPTIDLVREPPQPRPPAEGSPADDVRRTDHALRGRQLGGPPPPRRPGLPSRRTRAASGWRKHPATAARSRSTAPRRAAPRRTAASEFLERTGRRPGGSLCAPTATARQGARMGESVTSDDASHPGRSRPRPRRPHPDRPPSRRVPAPGQGCESPVAASSATRTSHAAASRPRSSTLSESVAQHGVLQPIVVTEVAAATSSSRASAATRAAELGRARHHPGGRSHC